MISGDTSFAVVWWWVSPLLADWWPRLTVASVVAALAVWALVNLAVSQSAPADDGEPAECAETVELPRPRSGVRTGTIHAPCQRVPSDAPTQVIERVSGR